MRAYAAEADITGVEAAIHAPTIFYVTTRRVYSDEYRAIGSNPELPRDWEETVPVLAGSADAAAAEATAYSDPRGWFRTDVVGVEEATPERLAAERAVAADGPVAPCCGLAVPRRCLCKASFVCPDHGATCHGSHHD